MYRQDLRDKDQSKIFEQSIEQFGRELSDFFRDKEFVPAYNIKSTSSSDLKALRKEKPTVKFGIPFFTYAVGALQDSPDRYNKGSFRRFGRQTKKIGKPSETQRLDNPWLTYRTLHLTPVNVPMDISYYSDYEDALLFARLWQQAADGHYLNFSTFEDELEIKFRVEMEKEAPIGDQDYEEVQYSRVNVTAVLSTYHGVESLVKPATSMKISTGIVNHADSPDKEVQKSTDIVYTKSRIFKTKHYHEGE